MRGLLISIKGPPNHWLSSGKSGIMGAKGIPSISFLFVYKQ